MQPLPRLKFAQLPTPVEALPRLSATLNGPNLFIKRDDQTGLAFGGNKTRKLEFLVAEARANGARTLITAGAMQSNHCRQTAAAAARFGMDCILVLAGGNLKTKLPKPGEAGAVHSGMGSKRPSGNFLLDKLLGAEVVWSPAGEREKTLEKTFQHAWESGRRPYLIPYGGSNPTGAAAYAFAMRELLDQCREGILDGEQPDWVVFASSSGGTQAGLVVGAGAFGFRGRVLGISVDEHEDILRQRVADLAKATASHLAVDRPINSEDILVKADYLGGGYGVPGEGEKEALSLFARQEGILLDPVYTGRAAAGMIDLIRKGFFSPGERVLFWHTGGTPALFADRYRDFLLESE